MNELLRGYRIGFQGDYNERSFIFKARTDAHALEINESTGLIPADDSNRLAQTLMLRFVDKYLREVERSRSIMSLDNALSIIVRLIEKNQESHIFWDSMGCSTRVLKLLYIESYIVPKYRHEVSEKNIQKLHGIISYHSEKMAAMVMPSTNHGLQGLHALVGLAKSGYIQRTAMKCANDLFQRFSAMFNSEGFYLENSSEYHFYACQLLEDFIGSEWYSGTGLEELLIEAKAFFPLLFADYGEVFSFGDSDRTLIRNQCKRGGRIQLEGNSVGSGVFEKKETGLAVSRLSCGESVLSSVALTNQFHSNTHNHHDYSSFEWFYADKWVIVDPGKYTYDKSEIGNWFYSDSAHNTINLSRIGHRFKESKKTIGANAGESGNHLFSSIVDDSFVYTRDLYHQEREIEVLDRLLVTDECNVDGEIFSSILFDHEFRHIEYLSPNKVKIFSDDYELIIECSGRIRAERGKLDPIAGWQATQYGLKKESWQLFVELIPVSSLEYHSEITISLRLLSKTAKSTWKLNY